MGGCKPDDRARPTDPRSKKNLVLDRLRRQSHQSQTPINPRKASPGLVTSWVDLPLREFPQVFPISSRTRKDSEHPQSHLMNFSDTTGEVDHTPVSLFQRLVFKRRERRLGEEKGLRPSLLI